MSMGARSYAALALAVVGFVAATVGADAVASWPLAVALAVGGTVVVFGSIVAIYVAFDDELPFGLPDDERTRRIELHAARNTFGVVTTVLSGALLSWPHLPARAETDLVLVGLLFTLLGSYFGWYEFYKRRM